MARSYLLIESRDPFESTDSGFFAELVEGVHARGNPTTVFLIQNGAFLVRPGSKFNERIERLLKNKVKVLVDRFALQERAITETIPGVEAIEMDHFVQLLLEPEVKALWH